MPERIQKGLFFLPGSAAYTFKIFPVEASGGILSDYIEMAGGICLDHDDDDEEYTVPIVDFNWLHENHVKVYKKKPDDFRDYFKPDFVYDCYLQDRVLDLNQYKISGLRSPQLESVEYDANKVVRRELSWKQILQEAQNNRKRKSPESNSHVHSTSESSPPKSRCHRLSITPKSSKRVQSSLRNEIRGVVIEEISDEQEWEKEIEEVARIQSKNDETIENIKIEEEDVDENQEQSEYFPPSPRQKREKATPTVANPSIKKRRSCPDPESPATSPVPPSPDESMISVNGLDFDSYRADGSRKGSSSSSALLSSSTSKARRAPKAQTMKCGRSYIPEESKKLLKYICDNDLHKFTGGIQMWKEMEEKNVIPGRTYQSLKEHFRKHVINRLDALGCSAEHKKKFRLAKEERARGKRAPMV